MNLSYVLRIVALEIVMMYAISINSIAQLDNIHNGYTTDDPPFLQEVMVHPAPELQVETPFTSHPTNSNIFAGAAITSYYPGGYTTGFYRTTNGGHNWTGTSAIRNSSGTVIVTVGNPQIVITPENKYVISYITMIENVFKIGISYSSNNGSNWSNTFYIPGVDTADKPVMKMDDHPSSPYYGRIYVAYSERSGTYFCYSSNSGINWSTPARICPSSKQLRVSASIATGPQGEVYVSWPYTAANSVDYVGLAYSSNGGNTFTFTDNSILARSSGPQFRLNLNLVKLNGFPQLAVDKSGGPNNGKLYCAFIEKKGAGSPALDTCDLVITSSTNNGSTWSPKVRVNESDSFKKSFQLFHQLNVDKQGNINLLYFDTRETQTNDSFMVYFSRSLDGGSTFTDTRVSGHTFRLKQLPSSQILFGLAYLIGSYIGLASSADRVVGFWYDNVDEQYRIYSSVLKLNNSLSLKCIPSGTYLQHLNCLSKTDTLKVCLRSGQSPFQVVDSSTGVLNASTLSCSLNFANATAGSYYIQVCQKNSISVWSSNPVTFSPGTPIQYDFTASAGTAFGGNLVQVDQSPVRYAMYSGDTNQDGAIDMTDVSMVENDAHDYVSGDVVTDLTGDGFVDITDISIADDGSANYVMTITP